MSSRRTRHVLSFLLLLAFGGALGLVIRATCYESNAKSGIATLRVSVNLLYENRKTDHPSSILAVPLATGAYQGKAWLVP